MTQPVQHGYPDYQRNTPATDVMYIFDVGVANANITYPIQFVGLTPNVGVVLISITQRARLDLFFYADAAGTSLVGIQRVATNANGNFQGTVQCLGPFCKPVLNPGVTPLSYQFRLFATPGAGIQQNGDQDNILISQFNTAIGAGVTLTFDALVTWPEEASFLYAQTAGTWNGSILAVDFDATATRIHAWDSTWGQATQGLIKLPAGNARIVIHNTSASAQVCSAFLIGQPRMAG